MLLLKMASDYSVVPVPHRDSHNDKVMVPFAKV